MFLVFSQGGVVTQGACFIFSRLLIFPPTRELPQKRRRKRGFKGVPPGRLKNGFFPRNVARNREAIEAKTNQILSTRKREKEKGKKEKREKREMNKG